MESVWWALKTIWDRGLMYRGFKVAPYCPHCMTPLSSHELALGYEDDVADPSVFVRFRLRQDPATSLLAWTTTPWTLPGNVALAVGEDIEYVTVRQGDEQLILAAARLHVLEGAYEIVHRQRGRELVGLDYEPLYPYLPPKERAHYVVAADFVGEEDGTGIVHTASVYGADDLRLAQSAGLPVRHTVDLRGRFVPEVEKFAGLEVKAADPAIIADLRERGLMYKAEEIRHTYPFCWRSGDPLIYYALDSWYIRTTAVQPDLIANNRATNWIPAHVRTGRMGDWLENNLDWAISRTRYWGTPLPIWVCEGCASERCVGSAAELGLPAGSDLHRPFIDEVRLACERCSGEMRRVSDVIDVWFDSGAMPFAQRGYPRHDQQLFEATFPADFICEALDQTRGWFYSLLAISTMAFGRNSYRNVICLGFLLDDDGQKMSKSKGNVIDPGDLFDHYGADAVRWNFFIATVGEDLRVGPKTMQTVVRQFLLTLWNTYSFFVTYANIDGFEPGAPLVPAAERPVLDRWLLSRLSHLTATVDTALERYDVNAAARPLQAFVEELSNWYVRRSRRRFWKSESDLDKLAAHQTLYQALVTLCRLLAPFTPFLADAVHRNLCAGRSVHLADFPGLDPEARDEALELEMAQAREAVADGLKARDGARLKVRQPLRSVSLTREFQPEVGAIIREELNVKEVRLGPEFALDTEVTPELRLEGMARDAVRLVQDTRKRAGLRIEDRIHLFYDAQGDWAEVLSHFGGVIAAETLAVDVRAGRPDGVEGANLGDGLWIGLRKSD
ncbi:MAG: isoleucine--tRNA ligase [Candidatus Dormibacteraeota bacterium]|nr:isoleucine--tRNA ligase [Candidatus Dormibacteraeota bacterium]